MQIDRLDHVNIRTTQLAAMRAWYVDVLGLVDGHRPPFGDVGAWLYAGDQAVVHLVDVAEPGVGSDKPLKMEHMAFRATGADEFEARLTTHGQKFTKTDVAAIGMTVFNIWDPDGNHIHVDFAT